MKTQMTKNGVTTTNGLGEEQYENCTMFGRRRVQYDYRHTDGQLFSTVQKTLVLCRQKRDEWLVGKKSVV